MKEPDESLERENYEHSNSVTQKENWGCGDCDPCIGGRPDQCAIGAFPPHLKCECQQCEEWRKDSSLEKWFPFTAKEMETLKTERDHYMNEMYRLIDEIRKLRGTI